MRKGAVNKCHYCGRKDRPLIKDHIVPRAIGGRNAVEACYPCNAAKGSNLPTCGCVKCGQSMSRHGVRRGVQRQRDVIMPGWEALG